MKYAGMRMLLYDRWGVGWGSTGLSVAKVDAYEIMSLHCESSRSYSAQRARALDLCLPGGRFRMIWVESIFTRILFAVRVMFSGVAEREVTMKRTKRRRRRRRLVRTMEKRWLADAGGTY